MKIIVNGSEKQLEKSISVSELILSYSLDIDRVIALKDEIIIPKDRYGTIHLKEDDKIELLSIVGGGWYG